MKRILIVEDDPFTAEVYRNGLEWAGFAVSTAASIPEATQQLLQDQPDALLLDLVLGEEDGIQLLRFVRSCQATRETPVLMLSNAFMPERVREAWEAGATECLDKAHAAPPRVAVRLHAAIDLVRRGRPGPAPQGAPEAATDTSTAREAEIHRQLLSTLATRVEASTLHLNAWIARNHRVTTTEFEQLLRSVHQTATVAGMAGLSAVCQLASVLEALLAEIEVAPSKLTWSAVRTINQAVEMLPQLAGTTDTRHPGAHWTPLVLTVDDEPVAREFLTTALESAHLNTLNVGDPELALRMCEQNRFDLAFLDVDMPQMNGFELCQRLHQTETNPDTPVVFVSSLRDEQTRRRFSESGALDFINKPVMLSEVSVKALVHLHRTHLAKAG
ncbi:MAG: response regulator [Opitutaceae bacterium]|nr:response regulator [Opitutaceae bacterium]